MFVVLCGGSGNGFSEEATAVAVCTCLRLMNASWLATSGKHCQPSRRDKRYIHISIEIRLTSRSLSRKDHSNCARLAEAIWTKIHHRVVSRCLLRDCGCSACQHHCHDVEASGGLKTVMLCLMSHGTLMDSINFARAAVGVMGNQREWTAPRHAFMRCSRPLPPAAGQRHTGTSYRASRLRRCRQWRHHIGLAAIRGSTAVWPLHARCCISILKVETR